VLDGDDETNRLEKGYMWWLSGSYYPKIVVQRGVYQKLSL